MDKFRPFTLASDYRSLPRIISDYKSRNKIKFVPIIPSGIPPLKSPMDLFYKIEKDDGEEELLIAD